MQCHSPFDRPVARRRFKAVFVFCGVGGGARGFQQASAMLDRLGLSAEFEVLGGVECDPSTARDFTRLTGAPCLVARVEDLTPERLREFFGEEVDLIFFSPPCKAASGLLSRELAATEKYQTMGNLGAVFVELMFRAWPGGPKLLLMENVPRVRVMFPRMIESIRDACEAHGFLVHESAHDLGKVGGLCQHRDRLLFVGRRRDVPVLLERPRLRRVGGVGEVLGALPLPGDPAAGRLHRLPAIDPLTALRLALIPPGGDWADLPERVHLHPSFAALLGRPRRGPSGRLPFNDVYRVVRWTDPAGCVTAGATPSAGGMSVADPRLRRRGRPRNDDHGVLAWTSPSGVVTGKGRPSHGRFSVADPLLARAFGVEPGAVAAGAAFDPRVTTRFFDRDAEVGVVPCEFVAGEDGRAPYAIPFPIILAADGTVHRPMTCLERARLQGFDAVLDGQPFDLEGTMDEVSVKIGDAVPVAAAEAIATTMLYTLLYAEAAADQFELSPGGRVWVRNRRGASRAWDDGGARPAGAVLQ